MYVLDTNAIMMLHDLRVPEAQYEAIWDELDRMMNSGRLQTVEVVFGELRRNASQSCQDRMGRHRREPFLVRRRHTLDDRAEADLLQTLIDDYPEMSGKGTLRDRADPWLVAVAASRSLSVVTEERRDSGHNLPAACASLAVQSLNVAEFVIVERLM